MRVNQKTIAELAGVSVGTVSLVTAKSPKVNENTRQKVLRIIKETGYRPNAAARSLANSKTHNIGICFYNASYIPLYFFASLIQGVLEVTASKGYSLMFTTTYDSHEPDNPNILKSVLEKRIDGAIICDEKIDRETLEKLQELDFPFVMVNRTVGMNDSIPVVSTDYLRGTEMAVHHMVELGHRRIGILLTPREASFSEERLVGYKNGLSKAGIEFDEKLLCLDDTGDFPENYTLIETFIAKCISLNSPATALILGSDEKASVAGGILQKKGYNIPDDISVIGMTESRQAIISIPNITTISDHSDELGRQSARMLISIMNNDGYQAKKMFIQPELTVRGSTSKIGQ